MSDINDPPASLTVVDLESGCPISSLRMKRRRIFSRNLGSSALRRPRRHPRLRRRYAIS